MHPFHFPTLSKAWVETWIHQLSLGTGFWGHRMQIYEPEWFRLILIFQSVDYTIIVWNKDDFTTCIKQYRKEQMDRYCKIIKIFWPLVWSFSHLSQLLINCQSSSRHSYLLSWHLTDSKNKYKTDSNLCTWKTKHNFRKFLLQKNLSERGDYY